MGAGLGAVRLCAGAWPAGSGGYSCGREGGVAAAMGDHQSLSPPPTLPPQHCVLPPLSPPTPPPPSYVFSSLDRLSMANIAPGSRRLWVHLASTYVVSLIVLRLLWLYSTEAVELRYRWGCGTGLRAQGSNPGLGFLVLGFRVGGPVCRQRMGVDLLAVEDQGGRVSGSGADGGPQLLQPRKLPLCPPPLACTRPCTRSSSPLPPPLARLSCTRACMAYPCPALPPCP